MAAFCGVRLRVASYDDSSALRSASECFGVLRSAAERGGQRSRLLLPALLDVCMCVRAVMCVCGVRTLLGWQFTHFFVDSNTALVLDIFSLTPTAAQLLTSDGNSPRAMSS